MHGESLQPIIILLYDRDRSNDLPLQQKQYQTQFAPMTIEKWASVQKWTLPMFRNAGFTSASIEPATRAEIDCACCDICNCLGGKEPLKSEPFYPDMYICDVCHRATGRT
eukprot:1156139-Pelagomonas_calceolata.AAC.11